MGLDAQFKQYLQSEFPDAVPGAPSLGSPAAIICDCMCALHQWRAREDSTLSTLADYLWRQCTTGATSATAVVLCFDRQADTPRPKDLEHQRRAACETRFVKSEVAAMLERDQLPVPWSDAMADRDVRSCVVQALAEKMGAYFAEFGACVRKIIVHGAYPEAHAYSRARDGSPRHARCDACAQAKLLGEGDIAIIYWMLRLRKHCDGDIIIQTVDTDMVPLAAMHAAPRTFVVLKHFDRKAGSMVSTVVDAHQLACAVPRQLGISLDDFVCVCITRGTDFVQRAVHGAPAWSPYVRACASYLRENRTRLVEGDRLDVTAAYRMLHSAAAGKRARVNTDQAYFARMLWNMAYWRLAPQGHGGLVDPMDGRFGWVATAEGGVCCAKAPMRGGTIGI